MDCSHSHHSRAKIKPLRKTHDFLCSKSRHYHNWHHNRYHKHIHIATLGLYILTIVSVIAQQFAPIATYAASGSWNLNTSTDYTYDNTKVEFSGGSAQLKLQISLGTGSDGAVNISTTKTIDADVIASGRTNADGVNFRITTSISAGATSVTTSTTPTGLSVGDEVLIINLRGTSSNNANVGLNETHYITDITGSVLTFDSALTNAYDGTTQDIIIQRIPQYTNVTVGNGGTLTTSAYSTSTHKGGVLFFRATGDVIVSSGGTIIVAGKGYPGGIHVGTSKGYGGTSYNGTGGNGVGSGAGSSGQGGGGGSGGGGGTGGSGTIGGAGGGGGVYSGGGGGYGAVGQGGQGGNGNGCANGSNGSETSGGNGSNCHGGGGGTYGSANLTSVFLGSGGGSGGAGESADRGGDGGVGGGIVMIYSTSISVSGSISANGSAGSNDSGGHIYAGGGGGGAGGSVLLKSPSQTLGTVLVTATGGIGGAGSGLGGLVGGAGGVGRIVAGSTNFSGTTSPTYTDTSTSYYSSSNPTVVGNTAQGYTTLSAFTATLGSGSSGNIKYQISPNGGTTYYWWTGSAWATTTSGYTEANTATDINTNISTFTAGSAPKTFKWKAYLNSDGVQQPKLDNLALTYVWDTVAPPNPILGSKLNASGGSATLTSGNWYNYSAPYFAWSAPTDLAGEGESASGIAGYYVYFGTDNTADPYTAGTWQTGTTYTASSLSGGSTYYLLIKTQDNAGNRSTSSNLFTYKYDATAPTNPAFVSVSPSGYSSTNSYTFIWASSGVNMASDTGGSGIAGYQYKTGASSGIYSNWSSTITDTSVTLTTTPAYQEGANIFQLRAVDTAGNTASSAITATFYYAGNAPSAPQSVSVSPSTSASTPSASNNFSFSWSLPATYNGSISQYQYSINTLPTSTNTTTTTSTSLSAGSFATQQGKNTLYVVAKDEAGNINYNVYGSVDFYAQTPAPGTPTALQIFDISNRDTQEYADSLKWTAPTSLGTGFNGYEVYRSADNSTFASVGTTSGTTYADTGLQSQVYYYYIKSKDNAGQYSTASTTVSITPTGKYTSAPVLSEVPKATAKAYSSTITWDTDREASSIIKFSKDKSNLDQETSKATESVKKHSIDIKGLDPETTYYYKTVWIDGDGNQGTSDQYSFATGDRPRIADVKTSNITLSTATISWTTNSAATSELHYGTTNGYGSVIKDSSGSQTTNHTVSLTNLDHSTTYHYTIKGTDIDSNTIDAGTDFTFNTLVKPAVSNVRFETVKDASTSSVRFSWKTNVPSTSIVFYNASQSQNSNLKSQNGGGTLSKSDADYKTDHDITVSSLSDQTTYSLYVKSVDQYGNSAQSDSNTFTTPDDTRPPKVSNLSIEVKSAGFGETQKAQIVASWETDEPATSQIEYGPGISGTEYANKSKEDASASTSHVVIVSELEPSKIYHLKAVSRDNAKNQGASDDTTVITGKVQKSVIDIIINSLEKSLGWMFRIFK